MKYCKQWMELMMKFQIFWNLKATSMILLLKQLEIVNKKALLE